VYLEKFYRNVPSQNQCRSALELLRANTAKAHRKLDSESCLSILVSDVLGVDAYKAILLRFLGVFNVLEKQILDWPQWFACGFDFRPRLKVPLLCRDLRFFGLENPSFSLDREMAEIFAPNNFCALLGVLYVTEGSTLGGRVIARHLGENLALTPDRGAAFFHGAGEATRERWREFCELLEVQCVSEEQRENAVRAASLAFEAFARIFPKETGKTPAATKGTLDVLSIQS